MKQNRIEEIKSAIQKAKAHYNAEVKEHRENEHLSGHGRDALIREATNQFDQRRETLRLELKEAIADERARLERQAFAAPIGQEQAYRDAISRASAITDRNEREKMLELAVKTNDTVQLRALATVSHSDGGWNTIQQAARYDKHVSALVEFEAVYGELRSKQDIVRQNIESFAHG